MNEKYNAPNTTCCGRPMKYDTAPKCNYCDSCMDEYPYKMKACIKKDADPCKAKAVIPAITVETVDGITNLANCFVHVTQTNTTFYIDDKHRPMIIWAGPVEVDDYDVTNNPYNLRSQTLYSTINGNYLEIYFDKQGRPHDMGAERGGTEV